MGKVFRADAGWYYQIDMAPPRGPFATKAEAVEAAQSAPALDPLPSVSRQEAAQMVSLYFGGEPSEVLDAIAEALYLAYREESPC
jgi:hypothetical protein